MYGCCLAIRFLQSPGTVAPDPGLISSGVLSSIQVAGDWSNPIDVGSETSYEIGSLENGTTYDVQVRGVSPRSGPLSKSNGAPYATNWSPSVSNSPTSVCPAGDPVVPKEFVVVPGNAEVFVTWRPCPDHDYQLAYRHNEYQLAVDW